jgi:branched-chain amino acid transport system substrate-binding protein
MTKLSRRRFINTAVAGAGAIAAAGPLRAAAQTGPIRIGVTLPVSGPVAALGGDAKIGAELAAWWLNRKGGVLGRQVEVVVMDTKARPNDAVAAARELLGSGVTLITGAMLGSEALAQIPVIADAGGLFVVNATQTMGVNHEAFRPNVFRAADNDFEGTNALMRLALDRYPNIVDWLYFGLDTATNNASGALFQKLLTQAQAAAGRKVSFGEPVLVKTGTADAKTQISQIMNSNAQGLYSIVYGAEGVTAYGQARAFGLANKIKVFLDKGNEFPFAKALNRNLPENFWVLTPWYHGAYENLEISREIYKEYVNRTGNKYPQGYVHSGAGAVLTVAGAVTAARTLEVPQLIRVLEDGLVIETPKGPVRFRKEDHQQMADVLCIRIAAAEEDPGFKVAEFVKYDGAKLLEPPSPGVEFRA